MATIKPSAIPATYDGTFARVAQGVPVAFMKATAWNETRYNPAAVPPAAANSSAIGLFQALDRTRGDFNKATGKGYSRADMTDPAKSAEVGAWLMRTIVREYMRAAPSVFASPSNPQNFDWTNPRSAALVSLGYTAGWSDVDGVASIVRRMVASGLANEKIGVGTVIQLAGTLYPKNTIYVDPKLQDAKHLGPKWSDPVLRRHVDQVTTDYVEQTKAAPLPNKAGPGRVILLATLTALGIGAAVAVAHK